MKSATEYLMVNVPERMDFVNITPQVEEVVRSSGIEEGLCLVNSMHITSSVFINDNESGLHEDYKRWLEELAPFNPSPEHYHHNRTGEDNADAHINLAIAYAQQGRKREAIEAARVAVSLGDESGRAILRELGTA